MPFSKKHWIQPRKTIANRFEQDDFGYAIHGAWQALEVIKRSGFSLNELSTMTALDYGCGTGRVSRVLSKVFKKVVGYDPVKECIIHGQYEGRNLDDNCELTHILPKEKFDIIFSINVMQHLMTHDQVLMMDNIISKLSKPSSKLILWYCIDNNSMVLEKIFGTHKVSGGHSRMIAVQTFDLQETNMQKVLDLTPKTPTD